MNKSDAALGALVLAVIGLGIWSIKRVLQKSSEAYDAGETREQQAERKHQQGEDDE